MRHCTENRLFLKSRENAPKTNSFVIALTENKLLIRLRKQRNAVHLLFVIKGTTNKTTNFVTVRTDGGGLNAFVMGI